MRTAALVGGPRAIKLIGEIAQRQEPSDRYRSAPYLEVGTLYGELMHAWEYFDPSAFAEVVLGPSGIQSVTVQDTRLIRYLDQLPFVSSVTIQTLDSALDLTPLDSLPDLQSVAISAAGIDSLTGVLRYWPSVSSLKIAHCYQLRDISALSMYSEELLDLELIYCTNLDDYSVVGRLQNLESLWLQGQEGFNLSLLLGLDSLQELTVADVDLIDLRSLADKTMHIITFTDSEMVSLEGLNFLPELEIFEAQTYQPPA